MAFDLELYNKTRRKVTPTSGTGGEGTSTFNLELYNKTRKKVSTTSGTENRETPVKEKNKIRTVTNLSDVDVENKSREAATRTFDVSGRDTFAQRNWKQVGKLNRTDNRLPSTAPLSDRVVSGFKSVGRIGEQAGRVGVGVGLYAAGIGVDIGFALGDYGVAGVNKAFGLEGQNWSTEAVDRGRVWLDSELFGQGVTSTRIDEAKHAGEYVEGLTGSSIGGKFVSGVFHAANLTPLGRLVRGPIKGLRALLGSTPSTKGKTAGVLQETVPKVPRSARKKARDDTAAHIARSGGNIVTLKGEKEGSDVSIAILTSALKKTGVSGSIRGVGKQNTGGHFDSLTASLYQNKYNQFDDKVRRAVVETLVGKSLGKVGNAFNDIAFEVAPTRAVAGILEETNGIIKDFGKGARDVFIAYTAETLVGLVRESSRALGKIRDISSSKKIPNSKKVAAITKERKQHIINNTKILSKLEKKTETLDKSGTLLKAVQTANKTQLAQYSPTEAIARNRALNILTKDLLTEAVDRMRQMIPGLHIPSIKKLQADFNKSGKHDDFLSNKGDLEDLKVAVVDFAQARVVVKVRDDFIAILKGGKKAPEKFRSLAPDKRVMIAREIGNFLKRFEAEQALRSRRRQSPLSNNKIIETIGRQLGHLFEDTDFLQKKAAAIEEIENLNVQKNLAQALKEMPELGADTQNWFRQLFDSSGKEGSTGEAISRLAKQTKKDNPKATPEKLLSIAGKKLSFILDLKRFTEELAFRSEGARGQFLGRVITTFGLANMRSAFVDSYGNVLPFFDKYLWSFVNGDNKALAEIDKFSDSLSAEFGGQIARNDVHTLGVIQEMGTQLRKLLGADEEIALGAKRTLKGNVADTLEVSRKKSGNVLHKLGLTGRSLDDKSYHFLMRYSEDFIEGKYFKVKDIEEAVEGFLEFAVSKGVVTKNILKLRKRTMEFHERNLDTNLGTVSLNYERLTGKPFKREDYYLRTASASKKEVSGAEEGLIPNIADTVAAKVDDGLPKNVKENIKTGSELEKRGEVIARGAFNTDFLSTNLRAAESMLKFAYNSGNALETKKFIELAEGTGFNKDVLSLVKNTLNQSFIPQRAAGGAVERAIHDAMSNFTTSILAGAVTVNLAQGLSFFHELARKSSVGADAVRVGASLIKRGLAGVTGEELTRAFKEKMYKPIEGAEDATTGRTAKFGANTQNLYSQDNLIDKGPLREALLKPGRLGKKTLNLAPDLLLDDFAIGFWHTRMIELNGGVFPKGNLYDLLESPAGLKALDDARSEFTSIIGSRSIIGKPAKLQPSLANANPRGFVRRQMSYLLTYVQNAMADLTVAGYRSANTLVDPSRKTKTLYGYNQQGFTKTLLNVYEAELAYTFYKAWARTNLAKALGKEEDENASYENITKQSIEGTVSTLSYLGGIGAGTATTSALDYLSETSGGVADNVRILPVQAGLKGYQLAEKVLTDLKNKADGTSKAEEEGKLLKDSVDLGLFALRFTQVATVVDTASKVSQGVFQELDEKIRQQKVKSQVGTMLRANEDAFNLLNSRGGKDWDAIIKRIERATTNPRRNSVWKTEGAKQIAYEYLLRKFEDGGLGNYRATKVGTRAVDYCINALDLDEKDYKAYLKILEKVARGRHALREGTGRSLMEKGRVVTALRARGGKKLAADIRYKFLDSRSDGLSRTRLRAQKNPNVTDETRKLEKKLLQLESRDTF